MTLSITTLNRYGECHSAECRVLFIVMLNVIILNVFMLNVIILNVFMLNFIMLNIVGLLKGLHSKGRFHSCLRGLK
jgi:hypothetical protein